MDSSNIYEAAKRQFYPMYGTRNFGISPDAVIANRNGTICVDPWATPVSEKRRLTFHDDARNGFVATLPQLIMWSFYGPIPGARINLHYTDVPTFSNCYYFEKCDYDDKEDEVLCAGNIFKRIRLIPTGFAVAAYVNDRGAIIEMEIVRGERKFRFAPWAYRDSYPTASTPGIASIPIHIIVWDTWVDKPRPEGFEIHHKDGCKWNAHPSNLELLTKEQHAAIHYADKADPETRKISKAYSEEQVRTVCKMMERDEHIDDIIDYVTGGDNSRINAARGFISNIQHSRAYTDISKDYAISNYRPHKGAKLDPKVVENAYKLIIDGVNVHEIARRTGINPSYINRMKAANFAEINNDVIVRIGQKYADKMPNRKTT